MHERAIEALKTVLDPDLGINIVDLGLIERLDTDEAGIRLSLVMTSPACPQGGYLAEQCAQALHQVFGRALPIAVGVTEDPPWEPARMSAAARQQLGWQD